MNKPRSKPLVIIQSYEDRNSGKDAGQTTTIVSERLSSLNHRETSQEKSSTPIVSRQGSNASVLTPPPPPPLPPEEIDEVDNYSIKSPVAAKQQKIKAPPPPVPQKTSNSSNQPPPCPPPDYDTLSISSTNSTLPKRSPPINGYIKKDLRHSLSHNGDAVEMESLESYKLNQQNDVKPKPPNTYFKLNKSSNGSTTPIQNGAGTNTTLTKQRPVSVIIGEYPSGTSRKQPKKLNFLNGSRENGHKNPNSDSFVSQFASELAQTLNRSNLRKKTESMENLLNHPQIKSNSNGSVRISVNSNLSKHLAKSTNDLLSLDSFSKTLSNRVTISIPSNDKKADTPSGILKHNGGNHNMPTHRSVLHQKSITFGEIPTVINDQPLHVT